MLPDDLPKNVIPFRPRRRSSNTGATTAAPEREPPERSDGAAAGSTAASASVSGSKDTATPVPESHGRQEPDQQIKVQLATATSRVGEINSTRPIAIRVNRRLVVLILSAAFVIGIAIAWGAIAVGARIVGLWPLGLAFYAMLLGGGATMMLTAALTTMLFFGETAHVDHDRHTPANSPDDQPQGTGDINRSSRRG